eukprot:4650800-Pyramimonas_sp.AAC.1
MARAELAGALSLMMTNAAFAERSHGENQMQANARPVGGGTKGGMGEGEDREEEGGGWRAG